MTSKIFPSPLMTELHIIHVYIRIHNKTKISHSMNYLHSSVKSQIY